MESYNAWMKELQGKDIILKLCIIKLLQRKQAGNTDKQGGNILIQTIYGDLKVMEKKKDIRAVRENASYMNVAGSMADCIEPEDLAKMKDMDIREKDRETLADILAIEIGMRTYET